jgi:hypothetical protein
MNLLPLLTPELVDDYRAALIREAQRDRLAGLARGAGPTWGRPKRTDREHGADDRRFHLAELWAALLGRRPAHR